MTALKKRIAAEIAATGPVTVAAYMNACLFDSEHGYYTTANPFGRSGDFITAPEISQMFGELLAVWVFRNWEALGRPAPFAFVEIGPGRGTLMADMIRTLSRLGSGACLDAARITMVEASPRLRQVQRETLAGTAADIAWTETVDDLPGLPMLVIANELFDAIPVRQFVRVGGAWRERMVALASDGENLAFAAGGPLADTSHIPAEFRDAGDGTVFEWAPAREARMNAFADRIARHSGAFLAIDYGHLESGAGDTLQAVRKHEYDPVLDHPGEADLTSHVDFSSLAGEAASAGLQVATATQGEFLLKLGLAERAGQLGAGKDTATRERLRGQAERLAAPDQMGELFKVMGVGGANTLWMP